MSGKDITPLRPTITTHKPAARPAPLPEADEARLGNLMDEIIDSYRPSSEGPTAAELPADEPPVDESYTTDADVLGGVTYTDVGALYHAPNASRYRDEDEGAIRYARPQRPAPEVPTKH